MVSYTLDDQMQSVEAGAGAGTLPLGRMIELTSEGKFT